MTHLTREEPSPLGKVAVELPEEARQTDEVVSCESWEEAEALAAVRPGSILVTTENGIKRP